MRKVLRAMGRSVGAVARAIATHAGIERGSAREAILEHWDTDASVSAGPTIAPVGRAASDDRPIGGVGSPGQRHGDGDSTRH